MLLSLSKFFLYTSIFAVAVVMPSTFFPFIGGKYYFFRVAVELALAAFILWWAFDPEGARLAPQRLKELFRKPLVIAVTVFVGIFLLASIFAYDANAAFWSNYERGDGGFQMLHYYAFFILLAAVFQEEKDWSRLFQFALAAAVLVILYGLFAAAFVPGFFGPYRLETGEPIAPTFLGRLFSNSRFQGALGNSAYVAPYLMFSVFYALWLWFTGNGKARTWGYGGLIFVFLVFFWLSQTRGAFLGLAAAVSAFFAFLVWRGEGRLRRIGATFLVVLVLVGGLMFSLRGTDLIKKIPGGRFFDISPKARTLQTRFWTWGSAWRGFKERPLLGWGPENFSAVFDKYFDPRHFTFVPGQKVETWFDRAHSIFFDYLSETGILGLAAFIGVWTTFFWVLLKKARLKPALSALLFAVPVGYLIQGLALFDVLPIYMNVFIFLAFASYLFHKDAAAN